MRLLRYSDDGRLSFTSDLIGTDTIPPYAILSHTWQKGEEVTYDELMSGSSNNKAGYTKILLCAQQAKHDGLEYFWVDTCCINKADQVELREAISSMFRWYQHASRCYVFLADVQYNKRKAETDLAARHWAKAFRESRWFTRGWTLQELLAPRSVEFFSKEWRKLGDKASLQTQIHEATRIPTAALEGVPLLDFSIDERLKWSEHRETAVPEDRAYCLIGILGVQMTPFYDEGVDGAFARLMNEARNLERCLQDMRPSNPHDDKKRIEDTKGGLLRGSYHWVLKHNSFQQWRDSPQSRLLWIKGDAGKGKTMLVCGIVDELKKSTTYISFFFCQSSDIRINSATGVLRCLIHQLVSQQPPLMSHLRKRYDQTGSALFHDPNAWVALSDIFITMITDLNANASYMIIDGLDECLVDLPKLLDLIVRATSLSTQVKWLVSSRNEAHIEQKFAAFSNESKLSLESEQNAEQVAQAVDVYIYHKLSHIESLAEVSLQEQVRLELRQKANGTFLWVALMMMELEGPQSWDPLAVVQEAPAGLHQLYDRMMGQIQQLNKKSLEICQLLLSTAVAAYRPLYLAEMGSLRGLRGSATVLADTVRKVLNMCGSFLTVRDEQIYFVHESAKDYLSGKMRTAVLPSRSEIDHDLFAQSLRVMTNTLKQDMYNLADPGLHIDDIEVPAPDPLATARYSCVHWVDHLHNSVLSERAHYTESLRENSALHVFLQNSFLFWLEALSLCGSMSAGVLSMTRLTALVQETQGANALTEIIHDAHRFVMYHKGTIEKSPLQSYVSALLFSPRNSLMKNLFQHYEPDDITIIPPMDNEWSMCLQTFEGRWYVLWVAVSPDSTQLASALSNGTIEIWHINSGACLRTLKGHESAVDFVAFSPTSIQLASASSDWTIKIWNTSSDICLKTLEGHSDAVTSVAFLHDSQLVSSSNDRTIKIWNTSSGVCLKTLEGHRDRVTSVALSQDLKQLASSSDDKLVKIWNVSSGVCLQTLEGHSDKVTSVAFSPDATKLASASGDRDRTINIWDTSGTYLQTLRGHSRIVTSVAFSHDSARLASASADRTVKIWSSRSGACLQTLESFGCKVVSVAFLLDSTRLVSASFYGIIKIWDSSCASQPISEGHGDEVQSVVFSQDFAWLASVSRDRTIKIWDTNSGKCTQTLISHNRAVNSVAFSHDSAWLASASRDRTVKIWDISNGACLRTLKGHMIEVNSVAFSCNSTQLASCDFAVKIWDTSSGTCLRTLGGESRIVKLVAFSHDSTYLASVLLKGTIKIWDISSGACLQKLDGYGILERSLTFRLSFIRLVWAPDDRLVEIWDTINDTCLQRLDVHSDLVSSSDLTSVLASPRSDRTVTKLKLPVCQEVTLSEDRNWVSVNDQKLLWLPIEYRPACLAIEGKCVALGTGSGKVWICRLT